MADKKISQLDLAAQINNDAVIPMSQENGGEQTTYKALITAVAAKIGEGTTFSNLNTNAKNLVGAINEIEAGGGGGGSSNANLAPDYDATSTYAVGDWCIYNGTLYQCNTAIPTAEAFDPTHWTAKKVVDELDDKVDTSDFLATNLPIQSGSATNTKDYIDRIGTLIDGTITGSVLCANNTPTQVGTITLDKGNYMVIGCIDWQSNTNGERQACISTANTSTIDPARQSATTINACSGTKEAYVQTMQFLEIANDNTTIYLFGWQNSGSSLNAYPYIRAMKVG